MSLINEALKRAQHDKQRSGGKGPEPQQATTGQANALPGGTRDGASPADDEYVPPAIAPDPALTGPGVDQPFRVSTVAVIEPPAADDLPVGGGPGRAVFAFCAGVLAMVLLCLGAMWLRGQRVQTAGASGEPAAASAQPEPDAVLEGAAEVALGAIERQLSVPPPADGPAGAEGRAGLEATGSLPPSAPAGPALPSAQSPMTPVLTAVAAPAGATVAPAPCPPTAAAAPVTQPDQPAASAVGPAARFTLGGIIATGDGEVMATINGKLLRVGETVDGGKLIRVMSQAVEMEADGQRFMLRM